VEQVRFKSGMEIEKWKYNCINRAVCKIFGVSTAECVNDIRHFVTLPDIAILVEKRYSKFMDKLIDSGDFADLFLANGGQ